MHINRCSLGVDRSSSSYQWVRRVYLYLRAEGRAGFASAGAGKREGPGLQFVSNKQVLKFISPFDRFQFLEVLCPGISSPRTYSCRGTGSSLISLVGLLKCHQKTAGMIDECPSGFAGPSLRHDTSRVQLLFPACGVLGTLLPSGPKVTTQKWSYWILWTCTSAPLNLTSSADSEVHPLCCLTQGIPQRPRSTGSCSVSLSPDVLKTEKGPQWPMLQGCIAAGTPSSPAVSAQVRRAHLPCSGPSSAPRRTCCPRAPGTQRSAAGVGRVGRTPSPGREVRHVRARRPPPSMLPGLSPGSCAGGGGVHP
ncbi:uncharacterized protein [Manis javanica]|uniref:uncharacterized protein isoform X2 n=1 Tax=Manis javanica TaxID=9974 RepID=UPI003C6CDAAC